MKEEARVAAQEVHIKEIRSKYDFIDSFFGWVTESVNVKVSVDSSFVCCIIIISAGSIRHKNIGLRIYFALSVGIATF